MQSKIPSYGSISRPNNPDEGIKELTNNLLDWTGKDISITYSTDEFTSVCPTTGQPDFNLVEINYYPTDKYIESKAMKFYLWSFREYGIHCEHLANKIANDIFNATKCKKVKIKITQKPRGGLGLIAEKTIQND